MTRPEPLIEGSASECPAIVTMRDVTVSTTRGHTVLLTVPELHIHQGEKLCVMGHSGAGKSLLLSLISGRLAETVAMSGTRTAGRVRRIGMIPQRGTEAFHPLMRLGAQIRSVTGAHEAQITRTLDAVGLDAALLDRRPAELSGGQLQRMAIAMGFLGQPELVLADEPTSALDAQSRTETLSLFNDLHAQTGASLVIATHDAHVPAELDAGRIDVDHGEITVRSRKFHRVDPTAADRSVSMGAVS